MSENPSGEVFYCDDYEAVTGQERDGSMPGAHPDAEITPVSVTAGEASAPVIETKVVEAPETPEVQASETTVETA